MDRLQADIKSMKDVVSKKNAAGQVPNQQQLTDFVKNISDAIEKVITSLPVRVKDICRGNFSTIVGWSIRSKTVSKPALFTAVNLEACLTEIEAQLANWSPLIEPSEEELSDLSTACCRLWDLDVNRLVPEQDYVLDLQQGKGFHDEGDVAADPLFQFVDERVFQKPTFRAFYDLLDNYSAATGTEEVVTAEEAAENNRFLNLILDTPVMQYCMQYLYRRGKIATNNRDSFLQLLYQIWFELYARGRSQIKDSSGFEHVFVGETKDDEVIGLHNWIQIFLEEKKRKIDYRGYIKPRRKPRGTSGLPSNCQQLVTLQFSWGGALKPCSSSFIGTSPEFEVALFTLCFLTGEEENIVQVGPYKVNITCHTWNFRGKNYIATSFPSEAPLDENEAASVIQSRVKGNQCRKVGAQEYSNKQSSRSR